MHVTIKIITSALNYLLFPYLMEVEMDIIVNLATEKVHLRMPVYQN